MHLVSFFATVLVVLLVIFINKVTVPVFSKFPLLSYSPPAAFDLCPVPFGDPFEFSRNDFL